MPETLDKLKADGAKLGVLSNKFDAATRFVISGQFPGVFDIVWGEGPDVPRKPDPTGLLNMMAELGVEPERVAYIGDSGGDMTVAHAAGCTAIGVTWGYRSVEVLKTAGADMLIDTPSQLYNV
jgi:phosphoglycolate phosphatase